MAAEKKAEDIAVLDVTKVTEVTDYFVLLTGQVDQHVKAIYQHIQDTLKSEGVRPHHVEGQHYLQWVLLDYIDVIVHVFKPAMREFYDLQALWGEAEAIPLPTSEPLATLESPPAQRAGDLAVS